ncbi:Uncharacterised protein [Erysipelothrix amsterdamensis]|uniref:ATP-binding protein n=2 Tax=Erysipelothrix TaxID=1647 RepID=A0AAU9VMH9_9FIRM|nr:hypothetical protein [Erysipelothrix rhusiopathiae]CAH2763181.1 Uncharacterised protein [Erysipelothrix sp. A18Y020d]MCG4457636.1 hypothetical protein [Erysipelothrix rhusiopathiae]MDE8032308.1 hypothetical protein [Erysipelothrix rhusiopathiae]MDE8036173.1 hypothetical protein [Erysipelothrix rhusiopathiae]MDE8043203.1 hypothetical protein [Erysipelothrix rhusiopathiae]
MNIEIESSGRNTLTGEALLRIIQNDSMPWIDLLVRESIQNSLDARSGNTKSVLVDFTVGDFVTNSLSKHLEGIEKALNERFGFTTKKFLSVRDYNTEGLTGPMSQNELTDGMDEGNLISLVYDIMKAQNKEGAGGSWGLGKTTYYRLGIGLVIYYSRIRVSDGFFEERLAINMVEDETSSTSIIPGYKESKRLGIAWWGKEISENTTVPVTDRDEIHDFLKIFGMKPYINDETGTAIIIPFVEPKNLLTQNLQGINSEVTSEVAKRPRNLPYWTSSIEEYLEISIQRWYASRLNNKQYDGCYLEASINGCMLVDELILPLFMIQRDLYNYASGVKKPSLVMSNQIKYYKEEIKVNHYLVDPICGTVSFVKVTGRDLGQGIPDNNPNIYLLTNTLNDDSPLNSPMLMYTRKPGMIVSYETSGDWVRKIDATNDDEYVIGYFVLNSKNKFRQEYINQGLPNSLEEYVRMSEEADHTSWGDKSYGTISPEISRKIKSHVSKKIGKVLNTESVVILEDRNSVFSKQFGEKLLPSSMFGKKASAPKKIIKVPNAVKSKKRNPQFNINEEGIQYREDGIRIPFEIDTLETVRSFTVKIATIRESGILEAIEYEKITNDQFPLEILETEMIYKDSRISREEEIYVPKGFKESNTERYRISEILSDYDKSYGLLLETSVPSRIQIRGSVLVHTSDFNIVPILQFTCVKVGGDK